jgi:hypothetical protein
LFGIVLELKKAIWFLFSQIRIFWLANAIGVECYRAGAIPVISVTSFGKIEVMKTPEKGIQAHVAIYASNFEAACENLKEKGLELEEPTIKPGVKAVYLKKTDPAETKYT